MPYRLLSFLIEHRHETGMISSILGMLGLGMSDLEWMTKLSAQTTLSFVLIYMIVRWIPTMQEQHRKETKEQNKLIQELRKEIRDTIKSNQQGGDK